jgi:dTDP-4-dehydrorhamnose 3,5-epimerase
MLTLEKTIFPEVKFIRRDKLQFTDNRGYFSVPFNKNEFTSVGIMDDFIQDNLSFSHQYVVRGMHYAEGMVKLVQCVKGLIWDVVVDVRPNSPTYLKHQGFFLQDNEGSAVYIPDGFAHGFLALEPSYVFYKQNQNYGQVPEKSLNPLDPKLNIDWQEFIISPSLILSSKDKATPFLEDLK